jgi:hypothetical protein
LNKRGQLFIRTHNETLSVTAMQVRNPDCSGVTIQRRDVTAIQSAFLRTTGNNPFAKNRNVL